ncbi:hypothetical protein J2X68_007469 [Streptomyces sp. 3330]|uniref:hypothetical protein n=1 Tax=Streptomyces sp. 3330 TaxID=2817755 RepID=UPI0028567D08|nr:hypothetical protein [Streptomyces sp. 3330]MDR6980727.1 hypothetical protein [Streptomyces sp. 3330]
MTEVTGVWESLIGERERFRSASVRSWEAVEGWLGHGLPADYRELVDGYGDAILFGHLFVPHPEGGDPLLTFMQEEKRDLHAAFLDVREIPASVQSVWDCVIPWAYHDWNGDVCLLVPDRSGNHWNVAVAFRQCPGFLVIDGGVTEFLRLLIEERRFPRGWPTGNPLWQSMPDSPLV